MGLLHLAVLGSPEVFHEEKRLTFSLRKAQALLLYLAVEGGMHSRGKLAAFLWPDSEPRDARTALRNALVLLRSLLAHSAASPPVRDHLLNQGDLIGLDPQAQFSLDQTIVLQAYQQAQRFVTVPSEEQRLTLVAELQRALSLVRGSFLDGVWLGDDAPFDEWIEQQQQQWQVRLHLLFDRLSAWHEVGGESEQAKGVLMRWLALDPLQEEAYRRLMRVHLALGDPGAALQVYTTCRTRLAEELRVKPAPETLVLLERARAAMAHHSDRSSARPAAGAQEHHPPNMLVSPLVGRSAAFSQLVSRYQVAQQGHPQLVVAEGEPGIGKTRLAMEFVAWARAQGAEALVGHAIETGGRLPYQPLVEAMRLRLEEENAPEDLLEDLWLAELSRLLPELRIRYPDLPVATSDELVARLRLFEAVARLLDALTRRGPLVLLLDDAQWLDVASIDLLRYLARHWQEQSTRVLLLTTMRTDDLEVNQVLGAMLTDLRRSLSDTQVTLQPLSLQETQQLVDALVENSGLPNRRKGRKRRFAAERSCVAELESVPASRREQVALARFLFGHTAGHPLILVETLKLMQDHQWLVPRLSSDGKTWRWVMVRDIAEIFTTEEERGHKLLPPSVRAMVLVRLARLTPHARQLTMAAAVVGSQATAQVLWQVAELESEAGLEALEEAVRSGLLREVEGRRGRSSKYRIAHELLRDIIYTELGEARRRLWHQRALQWLPGEGAKAAALAYHALAAGDIEVAYRSYVQAGDEALAVFAVEEAIEQYEQARSLFHEQVQDSMLELYQTKSLSSLTAQDIASHQVSFPHVEHLYVSLGQAYAYLGDEEQAQEIYEELLAYGRQQRLPAVVSMILNRLALRALQHSSHKSEVLTLLEEARHVAESSQDQQVLAETEWNQAQILILMGENLHRVLSRIEQILELSRSIANQELEARCLCLLGVFRLWNGDFREARKILKRALAFYSNLDSQQEDALEQSLPFFFVFAFDVSSFSHRLTAHMAEVFIWGNLGVAQLLDGQVLQCIDHGRKALAIAREVRSTWPQVDAMTWLSCGLQEAGAYEEALTLLLQAIELARPYPLKVFFYTLHLLLGSTYQALQMWEEAQAAFAVAETGIEAVGVEALRIFLHSRCCMQAALAGQWEQAYRSAIKAIALRKRSDVVLVPLDFARQYETEALLRKGEERLAREIVQQQGEHLEPYARFRLPYLQSLAVLAAWDRQHEQAIGYLQEAAQLATEMGLPGELWHIQVRLATLYHASGQQEPAYAAFKEAQSILQRLADDIADEALRARFLAAPSVQHVWQCIQEMASQATPGVKSLDSSGFPV